MNSSRKLLSSSSERSPLITQERTRLESNLNDEEGNEITVVHYSSSESSSGESMTSTAAPNKYNMKDRSAIGVKITPTPEQDQKPVNPTTTASKSNNSSSSSSNLSTMEMLVFFCLGLAPVLTWNCIFVSEAYFYSHMGETVLSDLGLCQNMASLASQVVLLFVSRHITFYRSGVTICLSYMMFLCIIFLALPINMFKTWHIFLLQIVNGLATGVAQTLMGKLGGLYGETGTVGAILFAGNGFGALTPPAVQIVLTFIHGVKSFTQEQLSSHHRTTALVVFSIGAIGSFAGILAMNTLASKTKNYKKLTRPKIEEANDSFISIVSRPSFIMTIDSKHSTEQQMWAKHQVWISECFIIFVRAVWLYILAVTPYVTNTILGCQSEIFWDTNLATVLIVATAFGDFIGRAIANHPEWISLRVRGVLVPANILRLVFVPIVIAYIKSAKLRDAIGYENIFILIMYFLMSATHGYLVVCLQTTAQVASAMYPGEDMSMIISQCSWLASQIGLVVGIAFSFIPVGSKSL